MPVKGSHRAILYFTAIVSGCLKMLDATFNQRNGEFGGGGQRVPPSLAHMMNT